MKIQPTTTCPNNFKKNNNPKQEADINHNSYAQVSDLRYMPCSVPSFKGANLSVVKKLPEGVLEGIEDEFMRSRILHFKEVTLFNKREQKPEQAFLVKLSLGGESPHHGLAIFDRIGNVVSRIHTLDYSTKEGYLKPSAFSTPKKDKYKGAGKLLLQACVEDSLNNGCEGKLYAMVWNNFELLKRFGSPIDFYQQFGFVFEDPNVTMSVLKQRYNTVARSMSWDTYLRDFVREPMVLKPNAVEEIWKPIIRKDPIFEETLSRL